MRVVMLAMLGLLTSWQAAVIVGCRSGGGAPMIAIVGITPSGNIGEEGALVQFEVEVDSSVMGHITYAWDFGHGVVPETSTDEEPEVLLVRAGSYTGSLHVSVDGGGTTDSSFTYEVAVGVPLVLEVSPTSAAGYPAGQADFLAKVQGTATTYAWTFDAGVDIATSSASSPHVELGEVGTYQGSLTVSNASYTGEPFPFSFRVDPPVLPNFTNVGLVSAKFPATLLSWIWPGTCAFVWNGRPGVFFNRTDGVYLALAQTTTPQSASDFDVSLVCAGHVLTGTRIVAALDDSLHILHFGPNSGPGGTDPQTGSGLYISSTTAAQPQGPTDWVTGAIYAFAPWQWPTLLGLPEGLLVGYATGDGDHGLGIYRPIVGFCEGFAPEGPGDWAQHDISTFPNTAVHLSQLLIANGRLYALVEALDSLGPARVIAWTGTIPPTQSSDWLDWVRAAQSGSLQFGDIASAGGMAYLHDKLRLFSSGQSDFSVPSGFHNLLSPPTDPPVAEEIWRLTIVRHNVDQNGISPNLCSASGRGVAVAHDVGTGQPILYRQTTADPGLIDGGGSWNATPIAASGGEVPSVAILPDQRIFAAWLDPSDGLLHVSWSDGTY